MKVVAFISQKGGVGKSTICVHMAVAAMQGKHRVAIIDTDPQESLAHWAKARENKPPPVAVVVPSQLKEALRAAEADGYQLVLIDSQPLIGAGASIIAETADLVLTPCQPGPFDIAGLPATMELIAATRKRTIVVLSRCPSRNLDIESARNAIHQMRFTLAPVEIGDRTAFRRALASGSAVTETDPSGLAAEEIRNLYAWMNKQNELR